MKTKKAIPLNDIRNLKIKTLRKICPEDQIDKDMQIQLEALAARFRTGKYTWVLIKKALRREVIKSCLVASGGSMKKAAKFMGIAQQSFWTAMNRETY